MPGIKNELPKIVETLSKLDYTLVWITVSAETAAGVPMMRKRWFMFGYKNNITNINILQNLKLSPPSSVIFNSFNNNSIISEYACMGCPASLHSPDAWMSFHAGAFYSNYIEMFPRTISSNLCSLKQSKHQISLIGNAVCVPQVQMVWNELINQSIKQINLSQSIQNNMNYVNNDFSQLIHVIIKHQFIVFPLSFHLIINLSRIP